MTDNTPPDENATKAKFKSYINEALDEREKAAADKAEADAKLAAEEAAKRPQNPLDDPLGWLKTLVGF
jgi:hypothetical protein